MTTVLSKGQNAFLPAGEVTISVDVAAPVDLSALLVTPDMRVRSDADFVFYNQPTGAGVTLAPTTGRQTLRITPAAVPAEIHAVRAVITLDDASSSFGRTPPPVAHVFDAAVAGCVEFGDVEGAGAAGGECSAGFAFSAGCRCGPVYAVE